MISNKYWPVESRKNKTFNTSGSDTSGVNTYSYNDLGYRGDDSSNVDMVAIGCSHTEGIGVNDDETWPYYLAQQFNWKHINFGFTGRSNDYIARIATTYLQRVRPKYCFVMYTYSNRREYFDPEYGFQPWHPNPWGYFLDHESKYNAFLELSNPQADWLNFRKNKLIVDQVCKELGIHLVYSTTFIDDMYNISEPNRFEGEYSSKIPTGEHATAAVNKTYANELTEYLNKR